MYFLYQKAPCEYLCKKYILKDANFVNFLNPILHKRVILLPFHIRRNKPTATNENMTNIENVPTIGGKPFNIAK